MTTFTATMTRALSDSMAGFAVKIMDDAVERLAIKYGFDASEAKVFLLAGGVQVKNPPLEKTKLPWCGVVNPSCCKAIVKNGGLFTQCTSLPLEGGWCKKCMKDVEKNGTPTNGDVEARLVGDIMAYKVGNMEVKPYIEYMTKNNITREQVEEAVSTYGLTIDPRQFEKKKRGRKNTTPRAMSPALGSPHPAPEAEAEAEAAASEASAPEAEAEAAASEAPEASGWVATRPSTSGLEEDELEEEPHVLMKPASKAVAPVAPSAQIDREIVADDKELTIKEINEMKKDDVHRICKIHGISIEGKNIIDLKKALKATVR